mmetsp:Transcript_12505/g.16729  ORF Transcript_12505/g.16729 Transcript_12505/m.16729 type:complete len:210 (-) Transcript_12505:137-766(-)
MTLPSFVLFVKECRKSVSYVCEMALHPWRILPCKTLEISHMNFCVRIVMIPHRNGIRAVFPHSGLCLSVVYWNVVDSLPSYAALSVSVNSIDCNKKDDQCDILCQQTFPVSISSYPHLSFAARCDKTELDNIDRQRKRIAPLVTVHHSKHIHISISSNNRNHNITASNHTNNHPTFQIMNIPRIKNQTIGKMCHPLLHLKHCFRRWHLH